VGYCSGYHTIQKRSGCYVLLQGDFSHGFFEIAINDHDYIRLNEDLRTWTTVSKFAEMHKKLWDSSSFKQIVETYLLGRYVDLLFTELEYGKAFLHWSSCPLRISPQQGGAGTLTVFH
jgi:major histocompatibility complex class I